MENKVLGEIGQYLGMKKLKITMEDKKVMTDVGGKKSIGFVSGVLNLVRSQPHHLALEGSTVLQKSLTHHWLTYCTTHLFHCPTHEALTTCLQYLEQELKNRAYLCGYQLTIADVAVYLALHPFIFTWSYMKKEQYQNISRWCKTVQGDERLGKTHKAIHFSRTQLYCGSGRTH
ncbi:hypothetical protein Pcinc_038239 [Petrolisthes cinctipes]|uniref:GST C-terminal domain-containing protein n=1 Tax=Petrolisthes cinctipes TaxID=88211 RepID=A0AAE1BUE7_PETCI|nr:hypothetical protein Pcinc_038239 [Petrolisthes cinctipes]